MNKTLISIVAVAAVVLFFAGNIFFGFIGFQNDANRFENGIKAQYTQNRNVYDNGWKKVQEMAQVPDLATAQLKELYTSALTARYGTDGSKALLQFIKEQNPTLDATLFRKIQESIEIFRNSFEQEQKQLIAQRQSYENFLTTNTSSRVYNAVSGAFGAQYPHIDLTKFDIVTSDDTERAFDTKRAGVLQLKKS